MATELQKLSRTLNWYKAQIVGASSTLKVIRKDLIDLGLSPDSRLRAKLHLSQQFLEESIPLWDETSTELKNIYKEIESSKAKLYDSDSKH